MSFFGSRSRTPPRIGTDPVWMPPVPPIPEPTRTRVWPVTTAADGVIAPRLYSYWPNAYVVGQLAYVFASADGHPRIWAVNLLTGEVQPQQVILPEWGNTEGWYWTRDGWIVRCEGAQLVQSHPFTGARQVLIDIGPTRPGHDLWQAHSSADGRVHCATVTKCVDVGTYPKVGTLLVVDGQETFYPAVGELDESALAGDYLVIKETRDEQDVDNCVIPFRSGQPAYWILDSERALGHSDCGDGWMVGEADKPDPGECGIWDLRTREYRSLFQTTNMGYVAVRGLMILHSDPNGQLRLIDRDTGAATVIVETGNINPTGDYDLRVKANISPCGRVACYMVSNGVRQDVFIAVLP